jgi:hypothetical protein
VRSAYASRPGLIVGREPHRWRTRRRRAASCTSSGCLQNATIAGRRDAAPFPHTGAVLAEDEGKMPDQGFDRALVTA